MGRHHWPITQLHVTHPETGVYLFVFLSFLTDMNIQVIFRNVLCEEEEGYSRLTKKISDTMTDGCLRHSERHK